MEEVDMVAAATVVEATLEVADTVAADMEAIKYPSWFPNSTFLLNFSRSYIFPVSHVKVHVFQPNQKPVIINWIFSKLLVLFYIIRSKFYFVNGMELHFKPSLNLK